MRCSYSRLRLLLLVIGSCWFATLIGLHKRILTQNVQSNIDIRKNVARKFVHITCGKTQIELEGSRKCLRRYHELKKDWKNNNCFDKSDGKDIDCHIYKHVVYVDRICPEPEKFSDFLSTVFETRDGALEHIPTAAMRVNFDNLYLELENCGKVCNWIQNRIRRLQHNWAATSRKLAEQRNFENDFGDPPTGKSPNLRAKLRILLHMGLLTKEVGLNFGEAAMFGGPLGELVQWSDLAATLHVLGHDVVLSWSPDRLSGVMMTKLPGCSGARKFDVVFTDIVGLMQLNQQLGSLYHYRCLIRVLDVYGTEPEFNHPLFNPQKRNIRTWGGRGLDTEQFFTHFPHSADNSFLGFVVEEHLFQNTSNTNISRALLYGKKMKVFKGKERFLEVLNKNFDEIHATVFLKDDKPTDDLTLPDYVINHQNMKQGEFLKLLRSSNVFVGVGQPVEGPAALEAASNGVPFFNPRFMPQRKVSEGKPTRRSLTSQNPYAEESIGEPLVYTVDIKNQSEVTRVLKKIRKSPKPKPYVPFEFTFHGFLERLNAYVENQDFCKELVRTTVGSNKVFWKKGEKAWPPEEHLQVKLSDQGESCSDACSRYKMVCQRTFFKSINSSWIFTNQDLKCKSTKVSDPREEAQLTNRILENEDDVTVTCHYPSYVTDLGECVMQSDAMLFSCACKPPQGIVRLCPCRRYRNEQRSLCLDCA